MGFFLKEGVDKTFSIECQLQRCKWLFVRKEEKKNYRKKQKELNILKKNFSHTNLVLNPPLLKLSLRRYTF